MIEAILKKRNHLRFINELEWVSNFEKPHDPVALTRFIDFKWSEFYAEEIVRDLISETMKGIE